MDRGIRKESIMNELTISEILLIVSTWIAVGTMIAVS